MHFKYCPGPPLFRIIRQKYDIGGEDQVKITLYLGQERTERTNEIKNDLSSFKGKVVIFDYNHFHQDSPGHVISLDEVNPLLSPLGITDIKALNAGFLEHSHILYRKAEEVLEDHARNLNSATTEQLTVHRLVEDSVERLLNSWNPNEVERGNELKPLIMLRKMKEQMNLEDVVEAVRKHDIVVFRTKSLHSCQVRALTYLILSSLSRNITEPIAAVCDNLPTVFSQPHSKLFLQSIAPEKLNLFLTFNRYSSLAPCMEPFVDQLKIFRTDAYSDIRELETFCLGSLDHVDEKETRKKLSKLKKTIKSLKTGDFLSVSPQVQKGVIAQ